MTTVAKVGSLFRASQELRVSESAISAAIKACETELGYSIFIRRSAKPLLLTRNGAVFTRDAQAFLENAEAFYERSVGIGMKLKGDVRIGCYAASSSLLLPPLLRYCQANLPDLTLQISEYDLPETLTRLRDGDIEIAVTYDLQYDSDIAFEPLFSVTPHIGVSAAHHLAGAESLWLAEIAEEPLILVDYPITKQMILKLFADQELAPKVRYYPKSIDALHAFVVHNLGYSIFYMRPNYASHGGAAIARIAINDAVESHNVVIARPRHVQLGTRATAIANACATVFSDRDLVESMRFRKAV